MKVRGKVFKAGNSYGVRLSKLWIESGIVKEGEEIDVELPISKNAGFQIYSRDDEDMRRPAYILG